MNIGPVYDNLDGFSKLWEHIKSFYGGYYPIGANNYWHTGLHVQGAEPVKAIAPGKIIAYRITHGELDYIKIFEMHNGDKYPAISRFDYGMAKDYRFNPRNDINLKEILDRYYDTGGTNDPIPFKKNTAIQDERHGRLIKQFLYCTSNNFVLVEHTIPFMKESEGAIKYYSLYMHLKAISSLTQTQRESITKSFAYTMEMSNNLDKQAVRNLEEPLPADRDSVLGFPGYIRHQSNICHIEIFSSDKRILELWKHADPAKVAIYGLGEYQVSGPVTCMPVYNFTNTRTQDIQPLTLNKDDKIQYYDVSTDYKGVIDCVSFKKESENDENIYRVKTGDIKREGYRIEGGRISADNQNGKIVYRDPLTNMVTPLKEIEFFYFFHPGMFIENLSKLFASDGWKLTKSGALIQGKTGWLIDENGYYILQDGRRLPENAMSGKDKGLRIGHEQPKTGLYEIMKCAPEIELKINAEYNVYEELLNLYGGKMQNDVVYQAFQINTGYTLQDNEWKSCGIGSWNHAVFTSIGKDETGIPIIVTGIGEDGFNKKKLVIAGPHGDERNAQRLILTTQRHFTQNDEIPNDLALYFIPSISPTMAFADARGIPIVDEKGNNIGINKAKENLSIPDLHELIAKDVPEEPNSKKTTLMRTLIQSYNGFYGDKNYPKYGVDANRDNAFDLDSSKVFINYIKKIKLNSNINSILRTETIIYDPDDDTETQYNNFTINNIRVLMIHGYESLGAVYGPYTLKSKSLTENWPAGMSNNDREEVNKIRNLLDWTILTSPSIKKENYLKSDGERRDDPFLYGIGTKSTEYNARLYCGEWSRHLYYEHIWAADIELPAIHNEGIRATNSIPSKEYNYKQDIIIDSDDMKKLKRKFIELLSEYPWI